jgi:hypothetical protein
MKNLKTPENVDCLTKALHIYLEVVYEFLKSVGSKPDPTSLQIVSKDLLHRIAVNVQGIVPCLELYKVHPAMILPIGLVLRSICSDFLTQCYLITFCEEDNSVTTSFQNEIDILNRDFLKTVIEMMEYEARIEKYLDVIPHDYISEDYIRKKIEGLKAAHLQLFRKDGSPKSSKEIRSTSDPSIFKKYKTEIDKPNGSGFITESYKWKRLENHPHFKKYLPVYLGYKVFSQFQHYSSMSMPHFLKQREEYFFHHLCTSVNAITILSDLHFRIIDDSQILFVEGLEQVNQCMNTVFAK